MPLFLTTLLPALLPAVADAIRSLIGRFSGIDPSEPKTPEERIAVQEADTKRLEALAKLDALVGAPSQWVIDLRGAFRYVAAGVVLLYGFVMMIFLAWTQPDLRPLILSASFDFVQAAFFFAFGDRVYRTLKSK